ncbi:hypothetical protein BRC2024_HCTLARHO_CDS_0081 [Acinetobacter phage vB_AbaS_Silvergun]
MAKSNEVTNNYTGPLGVGGVVIEPNASAEVPNWEKVSKNGVVAKWLESGVLSVGKSSKKDEPEVVEDVQLTEQEPEEAAEEVNEPSEDEQKETLIAQLAELGVKADKRSSVEKLQEKLEEALAK